MLLGFFIFLLITVTLIMIGFSLIGKSFGIRRFYVKILLTIFEYGRVNIESASKKRNVDLSIEHEDDSEKRVDLVDQKSEDIIENCDDKSQATPLLNGLVKRSNQVNGGTTNKTTVISRESFVLVQDLDAKNDLSNHNKEKITKEECEADSGIENKIDIEKPNVQNDGKTIDFKLSNCLDYVKAGMEAIIEDEVTSRFEAEELKNWNLLTRTNRNYEFISLRLTILWVIGFFIRYTVLMPLRVIICFIGVCWLTFCTAVVGCIPNGDTKRLIIRKTLIHCFDFLSNAISAVINYHNIENRPVGGICVANHTSPIDALVLMCDNCYSLIGQRHSGFLGILQRALARASPHIWFERAETKDRLAVAERLRQHVSHPTNPPILIFPEGTCINNTSVMQFKKGSFEVDTVIYPVAIKYDARFGDAFWNSSRYSMIQYLYMMMTSWAIVCDVWYLPPMYREDGESAIDFANRVKSVIAKQGGLVDLGWDGQLKRMKPKKELIEKQQEEFTKRLKGD